MLGLVLGTLRAGAPAVIPRLRWKGARLSTQAAHLVPATEILIHGRTPPPRLVRVAEAPLPGWLDPFRPEWVALVLIYWCMAVPNRVGVGVAWIVGLLQEVEPRDAGFGDAVTRVFDRRGREGVDAVRFDVDPDLNHEHGGIVEEVMRAGAGASDRPIESHLLWFAGTSVSADK